MLEFCESGERRENEGSGWEKEKKALKRERETRRKGGKQEKR